jgi:FixJ family two-component response regulator
VIADHKVIADPQAPKPDEAIVHVVDDDSRLRAAITRLLRSFDLRVEVYESALDFLNRLPAPGPGCLLLDLSMPEMDGLQLQGLLGAQLQGLPVIFVTGAADIPASVKAMKAGAIDFLTKPFDDQLLLEAVRKGIDRSRSLRGLDEQLEKDWTAFQTLTPREQEVCVLVSKGLLNKQIAFELGPTERTVKLHRSKVMSKLQVESVAELVRLVDRLRVGGRLSPKPL